MCKDTNHSFTTPNELDCYNLTLGGKKTLSIQLCLSEAMITINVSVSNFSASPGNELSCDLLSSLTVLSK